MTIARLLVWAIFAAEIVLPFAVAFWAGRRWERRQTERAFSRQVVGVAAHDAEAGENVEITMGPRLGLVGELPAIPILTKGRGFRRRRR